jgi:hypothetical protein
MPPFGAAFFLSHADGRLSLRQLLQMQHKAFRQPEKRSISEKSEFYIALQYKSAISYVLFLHFITSRFIDTRTYGVVLYLS